MYMIFFWQVVAPQRSLFHFDMQPHVSENVSSSISLASVLFFLWMLNFSDIYDDRRSCWSIAARVEAAAGQLSPGTAGAVPTDVDTCYIIIAGDSFAFLRFCSAVALPGHVQNIKVTAVRFVEIVAKGNQRQSTAGPHRIRTQPAGQLRDPTPLLPLLLLRPDVMWCKKKKSERGKEASMQQRPNSNWTSKC